MTEKDSIIQDLRAKLKEKDLRIKGLEEELDMCVVSCKLCRFCVHRDANCSPTGPECNPRRRTE